MNEYWLAHQAGLLFFLGVICLISLSNLIFLRRMDGYPLPIQLPRVSVLVPARNEENNIEACIRSLLTQDYPDFQILVLDDESQDTTGEILARLAAQEPRLKVITGKPLPDGWLGKHWACHQLSEAAEGEWLLFVDADTRFHPTALQNAARAMSFERADLLSAIPKEFAHTWGEKLVVPLIPWSLHTFLPLGIAHRAHLPVLAAGIGQFMLFRRDAYQKIGGFAAIREHIADDLELTRRAKGIGLRWRLVDGSRDIACRMYRGFGEACHGVGKSLFAAFDFRSLPFLFVWTWLGIVFLEPPATLLWSAMLGGQNMPVMARTALAETGLSLFLWFITIKRFQYPAWLAFFYPAIIFMAVLISFRSIFTTWFGRESWKGRTLSRRKLHLW